MDRVRFIKFTRRQQRRAHVARQTSQQGRVVRIDSLRPEDLPENKKQTSLLAVQEAGEREPAVSDRRSDPFDEAITSESVFTEVSAGAADCLFVA